MSRHLMRWTTALYSAGHAGIQHCYKQSLHTRFAHHAIQLELNLYTLYTQKCKQRSACLIRARALLQALRDSIEPSHSTKCTLCKCMTLLDSVSSVSSAKFSLTFLASVEPFGLKLGTPPCTPLTPLPPSPSLYSTSASRSSGKSKHHTRTQLTVSAAAVVVATTYVAHHNKTQRCNTDNVAETARVTTLLAMKLTVASG
jgi:hypothetical protein